MSEPELALHDQRELLRVTLSSIGDAVITTDTAGNITYLNPVAQSLTGWTQEEATGVSLDEVFQIVNEESRHIVENPATRALREGVVVGLANHTLLIAKDGTERPIDDSAAPIRNVNGEVAGVVLVFRDVTERRRQERSLRDCLTYCESIVRTLREPFLVLGPMTASQDPQIGLSTRRSRVTPKETENHSVFDSGKQPVGHSQVADSAGGSAAEQPLLPMISRLNMTFRRSDRRIILLNARQVRDGNRGRGVDPPRNRRHHRTPKSREGSGNLRTSLSASLRDCQRRHPHPRCQHRQDHRCQPIHVGVAGLHEGGVAGQRTLADRLVPRTLTPAKPLSGNSKNRLHPL